MLSLLPIGTSFFLFVFGRRGFRRHRGRAGPASKVTKSDGLGGVAIKDSTLVSERHTQTPKPPETAELARQNRLEVYHFSSRERLLSASPRASSRRSATTSSTERSVSAMTSVSGIVFSFSSSCGQSASKSLARFASGTGAQHRRSIFSFGLGRLEHAQRWHYILEPEPTQKVRT